jgi:kynurenine formamidase
MTPGGSGALGRIDDRMRRAALASIEHGAIVALGQPLGPQTPTPAHRPGVARFMLRDGGDYAAGAKRPGGFQFAEDTVLLPTHAGTHVDALAHVWHDDLLHGGIPADTVRSTTGAQHLGADELGPIVARGVLLDVAPGTSLPAGAPIGADDLQACCDRLGVRIESGDAVLVRTGWLTAAGDDPDVYFSAEPGLDVGAATWLAEREVCLVGADNCAIEQIPFPDGQVFPVHQLLIADHGIPLIEGLVLDELARRASGRFAFVALPLALSGCTASPLSPVAIL